MRQLNTYKIIIFFIINLLLLLNLTYSQEDINSYQYLKLEINNTIQFEISAENKPYVKTVDITSYFFPQTIQEAQYLNSFTSNQNYNIEKNSGIDSLNYKLDESNLKNINQIKNNFIVESTMTRPKIINVVKYPILNISEDNKIYLEFSNLTNTNNQIKLQASKLAEGENDVYMIASKVAKWVQEDINYDLSTITALPNQNSVEVFNTKRGVCKEITNLYISMMRSLGIPARVVSGYGWTNSQEILDLIGTNWGGHAWAEVLIGDAWVPFDLTYNEYGYVDASHIVIDKYSEIRKSGVETLTTTKTTNPNLTPNIENLKTDTTFGIIDKRENIYDFGFNISVDGPNKLGFDSYGYLKINIENKDNFYKILFLKLSKVKEVELLDNEEKMIIFKPNENKEIYYNYKISNNLSKNYIYTIPFLVYNENVKIEYNISIEKKYPKLYLKNLPIEINTNSQNFSNNDLIFSCNFLIENSLNKINCLIKNPNNFILNNIKTCINEKNCNLLNLNLNEEKLISFETKNYNETLTYSYENNSNKIEIVFNKPEIIYEKTLIGNNLDINTFISNYKENTSLKIYVNEKLINNLSLEEENIRLKLDKENNLIKFELYYKNILFDIVEFNQSVNKEFIPNTIEKKLENITQQIENNKGNNIFTKIFNYILNIFKFN